MTTTQPTTSTTTPATTTPPPTMRPIPAGYILVYEGLTPTKTTGPFLEFPTTGEISRQTFVLESCAQFCNYNANCKRILYLFATTTCIFLSGTSTTSITSTQSSYSLIKQVRSLTVLCSDDSPHAVLFLLNSFRAPGIFIDSSNNGDNDNDKAHDDSNNDNNCSAICRASRIRPDCSRHNGP